MWTAWFLKWLTPIDKTLTKYKTNLMRERKWERGHDIENEAVVGGVVGEDVTLRRGVLIRHAESAQVRLREVEDRRRVRLYHQLPEAQPTSYLVKHLRSKTMWISILYLNLFYWNLVYPVSIKTDQLRI